jgi:lantibiotic modifying enzyme
VGWGTAAPTLFFTEAFRTTGDERWLAAARQGVRWMDSHLAAMAGEWAGCGLFTGVGGWAVVLDELADAADDEAARELAGRVLAVIAARAPGHGELVHWHELTEIVWGTAGIGCLMLTLGQRYLGPRAVELAVGAGDWLLDQAEQTADGIRWSLGPGYEAERPDDKRRFPNFAHGPGGRLVRNTVADLAAARRAGRHHQRDPGAPGARLLGQRQPVLRLGGSGRVLPRSAPARGAAGGPGLRGHADR